MSEPKSNFKLRKIYILCLLAGAILVFQPFLGQAADQPAAVEDLNAQRDAKQRQLLELQAKIADLQTQINAQRSKIASLSNEVKLYDLQIQQIEAKIAELNAQIEVTNADIIDVTKQITAAENQITQKKELLTDLLRQIYEADQVSPLQIVLTQNSFSELLNQFQSTVAFQDQTGRLVGELTSLKKQLDETQQALSEKKKELEDLKGQAQLTQDNLVTEQKQKQALLTATRGQESKYKQLSSQLSAEEAQVNREIYNLDLTIRERLGDKTLPPVSGAMTWPMEGILTQGYGNTGFTSLGYTFHNGIDIAAPPSTPIHAAADGVVYAIGYGRAAYGNWVAIRHAIKSDDGTVNNLITLYGHMNRIAVSTGQGVLRGDTIGYEGNSGNTTALLYGPDRGYHVHFSVFDEEGFGIQDGAYIKIYGAYKIPYGYTYDPMRFLK
ncbi:MAG: peptidoglycan DD-metalloendopeptidase family protein [Patescibacteria group bacterium]|nr:peptidoglycan DD-metalloendopeptidase family protein [Patescibacteria group bacterium]